MLTAETAAVCPSIVVTTRTATGQEISADTVDPEPISKLAVVAASLSIADNAAGSHTGRQQVAVGASAGESKRQPVARSICILVRAETRQPVKQDDGSTSFWSREGTYIRVG